MQGREIGVDAVVELADTVPPAKLELETGIENVTAVDGDGADTELGRYGHAEEEVLGLLVEPVNSEGQPVVQEAGVETEVDLLGGLPAKVRVRQAVRR